MFRPCHFVVAEDKCLEIFNTELKLQRSIKTDIIVKHFSIDDRIVTCHEGGKIRVWNIDDESFFEFEEQREIVKMRLLSKNQLVVCCRDSYYLDFVVYVWNLQHKSSMNIGFNNSVFCERFPPNGRIRAKLPNTTTKLESSLTNYFFLSNDQMGSVLHGNTIRIWNLQDGSYFDLTGCKYLEKTIWELLDGRLISISLFNNIQIWNLHLRTFCELKGHTDRILGMKILINTQIASWSVDDTIRIWNVGDIDFGSCRTRTCKHPINIVALSNTLLGIYCVEFVGVWNLEKDSFITLSGTNLTNLTHGLFVSSEQFVSYVDDVIRIWNLDDGSYVDTACCSPVRALEKISNKRFASSHSDGTINIWRRNKIVGALYMKNLQAINKLNDTRLVSQSGRCRCDKICDLGNKVCVWNLFTGTFVEIETRVQLIQLYTASDRMEWANMISSYSLGVLCTDVCKLIAQF
jgi:hypothetical protein